MSDDKQLTHKPPAEAPKWVSQFLDIQSKELEERALDRKLREQAEQNQFELAKLSIGAQERALESDNKAAKGRRRDTYVFSGILVLALIALLVFAIYMGKDDLAMEIVKAIVFLAAGGAGGYALGRKGSAADEATD